MLCKMLETFASTYYPWPMSIYGRRWAISAEQEIHWNKNTHRKVKPVTHLESMPMFRAANKKKKRLCRWSRSEGSAWVYPDRSEQEREFVRSTPPFRHSKNRSIVRFFVALVPLAFWWWSCGSDDGGSGCDGVTGGGGRIGGGQIFIEVFGHEQRAKGGALFLDWFGQRWRFRDQKYEQCENWCGVVWKRKWKKHRQTDMQSWNTCRYTRSFTLMHHVVIRTFSPSISHTCRGKPHTCRGKCTH